MGRKRVTLCKSEEKRMDAMNVLYGGLIAVSMYSKIPVPAVAWTKERMRYALCWFPAVGAVCGGCVWLWLKLAAQWGIAPAPAGCIGTAIPILLTGGIHLDGFCDTVDARHSYAEKEKKLEILSDPHIGAFALIGLGVYFLLYAGAMIQLYSDSLYLGQWKPAAAFCFVFSLERAFSGLSVVCFPCAKNSGLAKRFSDGAQKRVTRGVLLLWIGGITWGLAKVGLKELLVIGGSVFLIFGYYGRMAKKEFGGVTGDLAGWFLQTAELAALFGIVVAAGGRI